MSGRVDGAGLIRLTELGALAVLTQPAGEIGFVLELAGVENRPPLTAGDQAGPAPAHRARYLVAPGQVAELIVALIQAARTDVDVDAALLTALADLGGFGPDPTQDQ